MCRSEPIAVFPITVFVTVALGLAALGLLARPSGAALRGQATAAGSVTELERRLRDAQAASNAAVARFQEATAEYEALTDEIAAVVQRIDAGRARAAQLRDVAIRRAVVAYMSRDVTTDTSAVVLGSEDVMKELRRQTLLEHANARDNAAISSLRVLEEDLAIQKETLQDKRAAAKVLVDRLDAERASLAAAVADAQRAYDDLVTRLAREAASRAEAERAARQVAAAVVSRGTAPSGTPVAGFLCPVRGSFTNDYGDPRSGGRSHGGIDIFAPTGTPIVAVKAGSISFQQGGAGGNAVYLGASDGNTYYYAHLSAYAGDPRGVSQGEVIGYVGQTGSATAPHLHFEIRTPSGAVNPYPTLAASC